MVLEELSDPPRTPDFFRRLDRLKWCRAFAAAMDSMTKVAVRKDMKARRMMMTADSAQPASWKAAGRVRAPVPTIKLKM